MKKLRILIIVLSWLTGVSLTQGQSQTPVRSLRQYVVKLRLTTQSRPAKGLLYDLTDSTIVLSPLADLRPILQTFVDHHGGTLPSTDSLNRILPLRTYRYADVRRMNLHRRGRGASGALWAAGLGIVAGLTIGDDRRDGFLSTTAGQKALVGVMYLPLPGSLAGAATGQRIAREKRSASIEVPRRFRKFTLVDQLNQIMLYTDQTKLSGRPWTLSVTLASWQGFGPTSVIKRRMKETGWASTEAKSCFLGWCSGPTDYPFVSRRPIFDLDLGYRSSARFGYQLSIGMPHNAYITGRNADSELLYTHNRVWAASFRWAWFSRDGRWSGSAGPALLLFQTAQGPNDYTPFIHRQRHVRPGLHLSGQYQLLNRQRWLLAFKTDARLARPAYTSAYTVTDQYTRTTYRLPETNVAAFSLNFGLQAGFKFR